MLSRKAIGCSSRVSSPLFAALAVAILIPVGETAADVGRAIPPGQEELLSQMLGRGAPLPGNCRFAGGGVEATVVVAQYTCGDHTVVVELRDVNEAPASAVRTQQLAIVVRSGPAPTELPEALATLIRAREAALVWTDVSVLQKRVVGLRLGPVALAGCVGVILLIALVVQSIVAGRRSAHQAPDRHRGKRSRDVRVLPMLSLGAVFLLTRLSFLTRLPAYVDESVHLHWARGFLDPHFIAEFSVGKWLPVRIMALFLLLPVDPLFAVRMASVAMGLAVLAGCVVINRELFSSTEGLLAGVVYTVIPYALLYDRMALADIYVVAFGTWAVYSSILAARRPGQAPLLAMSLCIYGAILSKPTGVLFLLVPILVSLLLVGGANRTDYLKRVWPTLLGGMALLLFLVWAGYGTGLLVSQVAFEHRGQLASMLIRNLEESGRWFTVLLTPPVALLTIVAVAGALIRGIVGARAEVFLALLLAVAVLPFALVAKTWYPSYLLFALVPISLLLARMITVAVAAVSRVAGKLSLPLAVPTRRAGYGIVILLLVYATAPVDVALMTRPPDATLPSVESTRYITGGLSGYGLPELATFLRAQAQTRPLNVVRFDLVQPPNVYLTATEAIHVYTVDHRDQRAAAQIAGLAEARRTLFVSNPENEESMGVSAGSYIGKAARIWSYFRPGSQTRLEVLEVQREGLTTLPGGGAAKNG
jgi:4-amino-4-deoxy-L-arabinose transferase-like glycosyltransferase